MHSNHTYQKIEPLFLTVDELAVRLGCSRRHLINLKDRRLIPHIKLGRLVKFREADVLRAVDRLTVKEVA
jgi:excisionase family DNA binding protein